MAYGNASATDTSAILGTFAGPHSATDSFSNTNAGGVTDSQRGFRFTANQDILLHSFGKFEPNGTTRTVTLFSYPGAAVLAQNTVSGPAAQYSYAPLSSPIWLTGGSQYICSLYQGSSDGYYFTSSSQIGQHLTYGDMRYCNSCTPNTFPTNTLSGYHYGFPDFWYFTRNQPAQEPTYSWMAPVGGITLDLPDMTVCANNPTSLNANASGLSGTTICSWSPSTGLSNANDCNPTTTLSSNIGYTLVMIDSLGCEVSDTAYMSVIPSPTVSVTATAVAVCAGSSVQLGASGATTYSWSPGTGLSDSTTAAPMATPSGSVTYVVTGSTSGTGCSDTASVVVTVNALPNVNFDSEHLCDNEGNYTLGASPAGGTFSGSNVTSSGVFLVSAAGVGNHVLSYTFVDGDGCEGTDTALFVVTAAPSASFGPLAGVNTATAPFSLTGGTPSGGVYSGTGVSGGMFDPAQAGAGTHVLTYTVMDANGCSGSDTSAIVVSPFVGTASAMADLAMVYPNPSTGLLNVRLSQGVQEASYVVRSLTGQVVKMGWIEGSAQVVDLEDCAVGSYVLELSNEMGRQHFLVEVLR